jgi:putative membrane protein
MSSIRKAILPLTIASLCWLGAFAQTGAHSSRKGTNVSMSSTKTTSKRLTTHERRFLKEACRADLAEVQLGKLAEQKAASPEVKQFAQRMIKDHSANADKLKQVAKEEGVMLPQMLSAKDEATKKQLEKLSGKQFDEGYMKDMVQDHTKDVATFRTEAEKATTPAVKEYASTTLPTLESHLKEARSVEPQTARAVSKHSPAKSG